ncbi:MAG: Ferric siderophore transport system, periplasmic binding protein TonB [uncultured Sulfurovum sp.]|uniref:Ferric siderophore transport system, periplasmic binding protein TonB n=1 Tax=uncultured Sulfurovum sp. TaxID=269237 RepID=A0A6S6U5A9_9BACT|nr:MAG: Ferric siderophore transport system, periplasmic binding protein TonB [uncultured Sulfurovum sp.]
MYYNSNQNSNDYYNSYKKEMAELESYRREESLQNVLKFIFLVLAIVLLATGAFYLYKYFNPTLDEKTPISKTEKVFSKNDNLEKIVIREEELPKSIQIQESNLLMHQNIKSNATDTQRTSAGTVSSMNEKDIELIVQIIMSQINTKKEIPLEDQLKNIENTIFQTKSLKETNHYNKIILTENEVKNTKNSSLMKLTTNLNNIMNESVDLTDNYSKELDIELTSRENAMRIIIVQEGDTLSRIAKKAYGDYDDYPKIFAANPEIIKNPNQIFVGQRLRIPS